MTNDSDAELYMERLCEPPCEEALETSLCVAHLNYASNAFNSVNRQAALHNISILCPALSMVLHNTYGAPSSLCYWSGRDFLTRGHNSG